MLLPDTIGTWIRQNDPRTFDRETIFDYINGAGEVYRSYAFREVLVERYVALDALGVTVEVFDMGHPEDAFGVFSYGREEEEEGIGGGFERKGSVLCFWQDRYYVCVAAEQRDPDPGAVVDEIARAISERLPPSGDRPALMSALPAEGRVPYTDRFFHTHQSLNYHYYLARENVLGLTEETDVALARYAPGPLYLLVIDYGDEGEASSALSSFQGQMAPDAWQGGTAAAEDGTFMSAVQSGPYAVVVLDAPSKEAAAELGQAAVEQLSLIQE